MLLTISLAIIYTCTSAQGGYLLQRVQRKNPNFLSSLYSFINDITLYVYIYQLALEVIWLITVAYEKFNTTDKNELNMPFSKLLYIKKTDR